jgi:hypothetical protein
MFTTRASQSEAATGYPSKRLTARRAARMKAAVLNHISILVAASVVVAKRDAVGSLRLE